MSLNQGGNSTGNYFGASLTATGDEHIRIMPPQAPPMQMSVADGKKQFNAYKPMKYKIPKKMELALPKIQPKKTTKKEKMAPKQNKSEERKQRAQGLDLVQNYLSMGKETQRDGDGFSRTQSNVFRGTSQGFSQTQQSFVKYTEEEIQNKVEKFYRKSPLTDYKDMKNKEEDAHQADLKTHREKVNKRVRELEQQRTFQEEIDARDEQLIKVRSEHDRLQHEVELAKRKLIGLNQRAEAMEPSKEDEKQVRDIQAIYEELGEIEEEWVVHDLEKDQLHHMFTAYKADILALQEQIQRRKEMIRKGKLKKEQFNKYYNYLRRQCDKHLDKINEVEAENTDRKQGSEFPFDDEIIDEMGAFHGRTYLQQIEEKERYFGIMEKERDNSIKLEKEYKKSQKTRKTFDDLQKTARMLNIEFKNLKPDIERLETAMGIMNPTKLIEFYEELRINSVNIKEIINNYKQEAEQIEEEIEQLKERCTRLKYEDLPESELKTSRSGKGVAEPAVKPTIEYPETVPGMLDVNHMSEVEKARFDADAVELLEQEYLKSSKLRLAKENEVKRITNILESACTTMSRIMYQLDRNKEKNVEIGKENVVEALSKVGMNLEKRLAYVHTKNRIVKDENVLMVNR